MNEIIQKFINFNLKNNVGICSLQIDLYLVENFLNIPKSYNIKPYTYFLYEFSFSIHASNLFDINLSSPKESKNNFSEIIVKEIINIELKTHDSSILDMISKKILTKEKVYDNLDLICNTGAIENIHSVLRKDPLKECSKKLLNETFSNFITYNHLVIMGVSESEFKKPFNLKFKYMSLFNRKNSYFKTM